ncbi:uncharacterized protein LOC128683971 [Plodia interpunctella]|uniref:uncharacterized protein LOC128683971 n=1 Tax=Plodia interpunctella TaxID=58824 RepID=UPI002368315C|nr:uncharacterized protein LOC128683971 [Plodia interpunctella]
MKAGKLDELKCILQSLHETIQIIVISETWIKSEEDVKTAQIPEYTHYYNHRYDSKGGGVSIFTHNTLKHSLVEEKTVDDNHYLWIHIDKFSLDIGAIYKPGRTNSISFLEEYTSQLEKQKRAVVFGDFNYDLLSHEKSADYKYAMEESGFNILNKIDPLYITRETDSTKSILDHVCTNVNNNKFHFAIIESNLSDHKHIYLEIDKHIPAAIKSTQYEAINYDKLLETVKGVDFNNTDAEYTKLEEILTSCVSKCKFTKTKKLNPPRQDWINQNIMDMINKRNELGLMNRKYPKDKSIQEALIKERKEVTSQIQKTKATYYHNALKNCVNKPAKMWTLINSLYLNKVKDSNTTSPNKLVSDNGIITDEKEMCEFFNDYFSTIGETLANEIPQKYHKDNIFNAASRPPNPDLHDLSNFTPASTEEVGKIIDNLKSNTASGIDGLTKVTEQKELLKYVVALQGVLQPRSPEEIGSHLMTTSYVLKLVKCIRTVEWASAGSPRDLHPATLAREAANFHQRLPTSRRCGGQGGRTSTPRWLPVQLPVHRPTPKSSHASHAQRGSSTRRPPGQSTNFFYVPLKRAEARVGRVPLTQWLSQPPVAE